MVSDFNQNIDGNEQGFHLISQADIYTKKKFCNCISQLDKL